jgi:hypothetical protein
LEEIMHRQIAAGLGALALVTFASVPSFAQTKSYYPSVRRVNDNGSVDEQGPGPAVNTQRPLYMTHALQHRRHHGHYVNQVVDTAPATPSKYFPGVRRANDNGSVYEPRPDR